MPKILVFMEKYCQLETFKATLTVRNIWDQASSHLVKPLSCCKMCINWLFELYDYFICWFSSDLPIHILSQLRWNYYISLINLINSWSADYIFMMRSPNNNCIRNKNNRKANFSIIWFLFISCFLHYLLGECFAWTQATSRFHNSPPPPNITILHCQK